MNELPIVEMKYALGHNPVVIKSIGKIPGDRLPTAASVEYETADGSRGRCFVGDLWPWPPDKPKRKSRPPKPQVPFYYDDPEVMAFVRYVMSVENRMEEDEAVQFVQRMIECERHRIRHRVSQRRPTGAEMRE